MKKPCWLIVHHTGGTKDNPLADTSHHTFETVNTWHRQDPNVWLGYFSSLGYAIGYHYFIDKDGKITQGRLDGEQAAHTRSYNNNPDDPEENSAIGICLAGNFDVTYPSNKQIESLKKLLNEKRKEYLIPRERIVPHRCFTSKSCYGRNLSDTWASNLTLDTLKPLEPILYTCVEENNEITHLKAKLTKYEKLVEWLAKMFFGRGYVER